MLTIIKIVIVSFLIIIPVLFILVVYKMFMNQKPGKIIDILKDKADKGMHDSKIDFFNYERIRIYLSRNGVDYMFDSKVQPMIYFSIRFGLMIVGFVSLSYKEGLLLGIVGGIVGFYLFDGLIRISNDSDNDKMLFDIKSMYDSLKIQTKAGVYLTNSLAECYICVESERLKKALLQLNNKIITNKDIETAIDEFNLQFNNTYIDAFCIVIKQSLETGQAINALADISNQISDVQNSIHAKQYSALERRTQIIELLMFVGIIAITIFYLLSQLSTNIFK